jgi:hypothetical protein
MPAPFDRIPRSSMMSSVDVIYRCHRVMTSVGVAL